MKKSFVLHLDSLCILDEMSLEQAGTLFNAIRNYHLGLEQNLDFGLKMAFAPFKNQFMRDNEKYQAASERNKLNGYKGGRPKKKTQANPKNPVGYSKTNPNHHAPQKGDNDSDNVSVSVFYNKLIKSDKDKAEILKHSGRQVTEELLQKFEQNLMINPTASPGYTAYKQHFSNWLKNDRNGKDEDQPQTKKLERL